MDKKNMKETGFSVLMSVYFKEKQNNLERALDSIFAKQTFKPTEFILVCDGELTPELDRLIDSFKANYPEIIKVFRKERGGLGKALNYGLPKCSYELVARADGDDICLPNRFEEQVKFMESHPEIDVCSAWLEEFSDDPNIVESVKKVPETPEEIYSFGKSRNPMNHPVVMFRKSAVMKNGSYLHFPLLEDYYLWVRMLCNGSKMYNIQKSLLLFRANRNMIKRRGGLKYAVTETKFQKTLYDLNYISLPCMVKNLIIRWCARLMPTTLRTALYKKLRG